MLIPGHRAAVVQRMTVVGQLQRQSVPELREFQKMNQQTSEHIHIHRLPCDVQENELLGHSLISEKFK